MKLEYRYPCGCEVPDLITCKWCDHYSDCYARFNPEFVLLRRLDNQHKLFKINIPGRDPTRCTDGTIGYKILGYSHSREEAQKRLNKYRN